MAGLLKSLKRTNAYNQGGVLAVLCIPTLLDTGAAGFSVTRTSGTVSGITPAGTNQFQLIEPEENSCSFTENLKIGGNRYIAQGISFKYGPVEQRRAAPLALRKCHRLSHLVETRRAAFHRNAAWRPVPRLSPMITTQTLLAICSGLLLVLVGIVGFFARRVLAQNDEAQKAAIAANAALA